MNNRMIPVDSDTEIALAKLGKILSTYCRRALPENGDAENLLRCLGLSYLVDRYAGYLNPNYISARGYKSENYNYNSTYAINEILVEISEDKRIVGEFLNEFLSRLDKIEDEDINKIESYLEVLGYKLKSEEKDSIYGEEWKYSLESLTAGSLGREEDVSFLERKLKSDNDTYITYYSDAIWCYANSKYPACVGNCRTLLEKVFGSEDSENGDYIRGVLNVTKESTPPGSGTTPRMSKKGIFKYWIEENQGFNRFRLFTTLYSTLSGLGPHGEEIPSKEDALLCLRITEDILIWYYQNK